MLPPLAHRVALLCMLTGRRLAHSDHPRPREISPPEAVIGILVIFTSFLTPGAYVLSNLQEFRRE